MRWVSARRVAGRRALAGRVSWVFRSRGGLDLPVGLPSEVRHVVEDVQFRVVVCEPQVVE